MLNAAIEDELAFLWQQYVKAPDDNLTHSARGLKQRLKNAFRITLDAAQAPGHPPSSDGKRIYTLRTSANISIFFMSIWPD